MSDLPQPFSGPRYHENAQRTGGEEPCVLCGRAIKDTATAPYAIVVDGGDRFALANETPNEKDPGFMGGYPVGPECAKKLKPALREA